MINECKKMALRMNSFLELNWLARHDKDILLPLILISSEYACGGYYLSPKKQECLIDDRYYPQDRGVIVVNNNEFKDSPESIVAHEWRHLWQTYQGWPKEVDTSWFNLDELLSYKQKIIEYFNRSFTEMDALLFELKKAPCDAVLMWYEWLVKHKEMKRSAD